MWYVLIGIGIVLVVLVVCLILIKIRNAERTKLVNNALNSMGIKQEILKGLFGNYNKHVEVKSRQTLEKYDLASYFKANRDAFEKIKNILNLKQEIHNKMKSFLADNSFKNERHYKFLVDFLEDYLSERIIYIIRVRYITKAGNCLAQKDLQIDLQTLNRIENTPELYMTKSEMKEIEKVKLENNKKEMYSRVNDIIDDANSLKNDLITKNDSKTLDDLIEKLYNRTVNSIQKIKQLDSEEWSLIDHVIKDVEEDILKIKKRNTMLMEYYTSKDFEALKKSCELLMNSQKEFNEYIEEKIESISKMFGTRAVRNETEHEDVYNYVRTYNKTVSPFTAELSSNVFSSAENNPIQYLIKCFYPNKSLYKEQIVNLKNLLNELSALKDAKSIIDNYKKDYQKYMDNVPSFVLEEDEDGFYSRLGFAIIDENVMNVEYKFVYTSNGGMAQRSFTIPMTEETIAQLIEELQNKISSASLAKEQRALMTQKLRLAIKERDHYTCCICGNSTNNEPNLLLEIDHIKPIAKGGLTVEDNLQTLCWKCNRNKGAKLI